MLYILFISLVVMLFFAYLITGKDILSPWIISIFMFILTVGVAMVNIDYWKKDIGPYTIIVVLIALLSWGMGEIFGKKIISKKKNVYHDEKSFSSINGGGPIKIEFRFLLLSISFIMIVTFFYFDFIRVLALSAGNQSGLDGMLHYARNAQFDDSINSDQSFLLNMGITFSRVISYFFIYVFISNLVFSKFKISLMIYLLPAFINFGNILLSTGRTQFINMIAFSLILFFLLLKKKYNWSTKLDLKIIVIGILGIIVFLFIFRVSGYLTGKSLNYNLWDNISKYLGTPVVALDIYLKNPPTKDFFGKETFSSVYHILRKLGLEIPSYSVPHEFISWNNITNVNIYTSFRRYIQDFSIGGLVFMQFIIGGFYGAFYQYIKAKKSIGLSVIVYSMIFFPIVQVAIEERFFMNITAIGTIYNLIALLIVWKFFEKRSYNLNTKIQVNNF